MPWLEEASQGDCNDSLVWGTQDNMCELYGRIELDLSSIWRVLRLRGREPWASWGDQSECHRLSHLHWRDFVAGSWQQAFIGLRSFVHNELPCNSRTHRSQRRSSLVCGRGLQSPLHPSRFMLTVHRLHHLLPMFHRSLLLPSRFVCLLIRP